MTGSRPRQYQGEMPLYRVSSARPDAHRLQVEATFPRGARTLSFAAWAPGSYLMREFARNLRDLSASTPDGAPIALTATANNRWAVHGEGPLVVRYEVYCREKSVRTPFVDGSLQFWLPSNVLLYDESARGGVHTLEVQVPAGHVGVCLGAGAAAGPVVATWAHADLDTLMDSPVAIAPFEHTSFAVDGVEHHHWIEPGHNGDLARINEDLRRVVATAHALAGGALPYRRYDFVTLLAARGHGGLEHKEGSVLLRPRASLKEPRDHEELLTLAAHEHFHAWNVKRLHPDTLGPAFDYGREHYTRDLWWLEGGTVFFEERLAHRAGIVDTERHLARLADLLQRNLDTPGRGHLSLEEASFSAWVKLYRPGEDTSNSTISYYLKGAVVLLALDLELLHLTGGQRGVDDLFRSLWSRWGAHGVAYPEGDTLRDTTLELLDGVAAPERAAFTRLWDKGVRGTGDLDLVRAFDHAGIDLTRPAPKTTSWLGVKLNGGERIVVDSVREDGPSDGVLAAGDELLGFGGLRVLASDLADRLRDHPAGEPARLLIARDGLLLERSVTPTPPPPSEVTLRLRPVVDSARLAVRTAFLAGRTPG